ncbi:exodeoxyribonuclease V subunit alpha [Marinomonas agarivorans]|nr:exodeoxyribonuclease V subunit alpha [Marinomonas agarivorans]
MTSSDKIIEQMAHWQQLGLIRAIDLYWIKELAGLLTENASQQTVAQAIASEEVMAKTPASVLLAGMAVSYSLGQGHVCLLLSELFAKPFAGLLEANQMAKSQINDVASWQACLSSFGIVSYQQILDELRTSVLVEDRTRPNHSLLENTSTTAPMVLVNDRLYLRRYFDYETSLVNFIQQAQQRPLYPFKKAWLDTLFSENSTSTSTSPFEIDWQKLAVANSALQAFSIISGGPGTGKTTTVTKLLALLTAQTHEEGKSLRIELAAPTGKAAARLTESIIGAKAALLHDNALPTELLTQIPEQASTLHRLLGSRFGRSQFIHHKENPLHLDVLLVDEASMVDLPMMAKLLDALPEHARLILLGDKDQLASVEAGSALADLTYGIENHFYSADWLAKLTQASGMKVTQAPVANNVDENNAATENNADTHLYNFPMRQHLSLLSKSYRFAANSGIGQLAKAVNQADIERSIELLQAAPKKFPPSTVAAQSDNDSVAWLPLSEATRKTRQQKQDISESVIDIAELAVGYHPYWQKITNYLASNNVDANELTESSLVANKAIQSVFKAFSQYQVLTAMREGAFGVEQLNRHLQSHFFTQGWIQSGQITEQMPTWYAGKAIIITRNDAALDLFNGDIGICLPDHNSKDGRLRVWFELANGDVRGYLPSRLTNYEAVFVMTVHKSQGSEFEHVELILPTYDNSILTRELFYTGITRAKKRFRLWATLSSVKATLATNVKRYSGLTDLLWRT